MNEKQGTISGKEFMRIVKDKTDDGTLNDFYKDYSNPLKLLLLKKELKESDNSRPIKPFDPLSINP